MSRVTAGEVAITLNGEERILKPTLGAATRVNKAFDGYQNANRRVAALDLEAYVFIIRQGLGLADGDEKDLREHVWRAGVTNLSGPVATYVAILANGGRPLDDQPSEESAGGNG